MRNAFEYATTVFSRNNEIFLQRHTGPIYHPKFPTSGYIIHTVEINEQYRPDKIAYLYYGFAGLHWVLDAVNSFYNGFSEYTEGTEIKVPLKQTLFDLGILATEDL